MKKMFITIGLLLILIASFAQSSDIKILFNERTIGRMIATQEEIKAKEYIFPERIYQSYIDTISNSITLQLCKLSKNEKTIKNKGKIVFYDLTDEKVKWTKKIAYQKSRLYQFDGTIIYTAAGLGNKCFSLNIENGKNMWKAETIIHFVDPAAQIGIGYKYGVNDENMLDGINLRNGKGVWQRKLNKEYGWNDWFRLNDSTWMIVAAGLHTVKIHDGSGWSYHAVTGKKDYKAATAITAAGLALGIFTGTYIIATGHNLVKDVVSNVYSDSTGYYVASKERLSRIRKDDGTEYWYHLLPEDLTSKSSIFSKGDTLFMVNHGYAFMNNRLINFGTPFLAAFNKETAEQLFFNKIDTKKNPILDLKVENDNIMLLSKDRMMKCSLINGSTISEKTIDGNVSGELKGFVSNRVYFDATNSTMTNLVLSDISQKYIITDKNKVLIFDAELNITGDIDFSQLYLAQLKTNDYLLVTNEHQSFILDVDNNKVAKIDMKLRPALIGNKLYSIHEKSFFEIDLKNLKTESLPINSAGQRPAERNTHVALKPQRGVIHLVIKSL